MKKQLFKTFIADLLILAMFLALFLPGVHVSASDNPGDIMADTWVGADELEREFPTNKQVGNVKKDKYVGIFYFLFCFPNNARIVDTTETYLKYGVEGVWRIIPQDGFHVWARPYFGYYRNTDQWIFQKHAQLLTDAGIDFVFLDTTNMNGLYEGAWTALLDTWAELRSKGVATPQVVFHNGSEPQVMNEHVKVQINAYKNEKYKDLWFMWDGKPLILGDDEFLPFEYCEYFTIRKSWAFNSFTGSGEGRWPWIAEYPQLPGKSPEGKIEQVVVSAGFHSNSSNGRSFHNGAEESSGIRDFGYGLEDMDKGLAFAEQWSRVFEINPSVVMITGWNEFTFGRWVNAGPGQLISSSYNITEDDPVFCSNYIDAFSAEFSRDIEPVSQLFRDNYYCQMVQNIRKFKGVRKIEEGTGSVDIDMDSDFSQFRDIGPVYYDTLYDTAHRNYEDVSGEPVINETGRNDFKEVRVSKTDEFVYFYAKCTENITVPEENDPTWMNLFVDSDQKHTTGWSGYDFAAGFSRTLEYKEAEYKATGHFTGTVTVEAFNSDVWSDRTPVGEGTYSVSGSTIVIKIPAGLLNLSERDNFDFKLADHSTSSGEVMEFMDLGDAAPNSRFNYRYIKKGGKIVSDEASSPLKIIIPVVIAVIAAASVAVFLSVRSKKNKADRH